MRPQTQCGARARQALAALLLAGAAASAQAALFNFSGLTDSGPLAGQAFSGQFAYAEPAVGFDGVVALDAFSLSFAGQAYSLATADAGTLPVASYFGGSFVGIDYLDTASADPGLRPQLQFTAGFFDASQALFSYVGRDALGAAVLGFGSYSVSVVTSAVPEPGGLALALAGLGVLGAAARRRRSG